MATQSTHPVYVGPEEGLTQNSCPHTPTIVRSLNAIRQITHLSLFESPCAPSSSLRVGMSTGSSGCAFASPSQSIFFRLWVNRSDWVVGRGGHVRGGETRACSSKNPSASSTIVSQQHAARAVRTGWTDGISPGHVGYASQLDRCWYGREKREVIYTERRKRDVIYRKSSRLKVEDNKTRFQITK